jgi:hypothetical protein
MTEQPNDKSIDDQSASTEPDAGSEPAVPALTRPAPDEPTEPLRDLTIEHGGLDSARAERVSVNHGGITNVEATSVDLRQGGITRVNAKKVEVTQGGVALARADHLSTQMSAVAVAVSGDARLDRSFVRNLFAREVRIEQGGVWNLAAARVTFQRPSLAGIVIAAKVDGEVRPILDWRGAIAVGAVAGLLVGILRRR